MSEPQDWKQRLSLPGAPLIELTFGKKEQEMFERYPEIGRVIKGLGAVFYERVRISKKGDKTLNVARDHELSILEAGLLKRLDDLCEKEELPKGGAVQNQIAACRKKIFKAAQKIKPAYDRYEEDILREPPPLSRG